MNYCFGRSPSEVDEYLEANFDLAPDSEGAGGRFGDATENVEGHGLAGPDTADGLKSGGTDGEAAAQLDGGSETASGPVGKDGEGGPAGRDISIRKDRQVRRPSGPSILERFARKEGFTNDGNDCYRGADGSWIARTDGDRFPWERRTGAGELIRSYWPEEHCLEREPLELDADIWSLIEKRPDTCALILDDERGVPVEVLGNQLRAMREGGTLILYPATYRLVVKHAIRN